MISRHSPICRLYKLIAGTFLVIIIGGCASIPPLSLKKPSLDFQDFEVTSLGLQNIAFALTIRAQNPNDVAIPVSELNFDLDLLGQSFASGKTQEQTVTLPAQASKDVKVDFIVPTGQLIRMLRSLRTAKIENLGYALRGSTRWGPNGIRLPFERNGDFNLLQELQQLLAPITDQKN